MSMIKRDPIVYDDGRTKQSFKDSTDINKILKQAQKQGSLDHLTKHGATYGDFADFDFFEAQNQLAKAREIFDELPSEVRKEFGNDPGRFFEYANKPEHVGRLAELLPSIAEPGLQTPVVNRTAPRAPQAAVEAPEETTEAVVTPTDETP